MISTCAVAKMADPHGAQIGEGGSDLSGQTWLWTTQFQHNSIMDPVGLNLILHVLACFFTWLKLEKFDLQQNKKIYIL
jgi:hypothetical protein